MQTIRTRSIQEVLVWTRGDIYLLLVLAAIPTVLYQLLGWKWLSLPWLPITLMGTAVSFIVSCKNNASYERAWEARKVWGAIINTSRAFAGGVIGYIEATAPDKNGIDPVHTRLAYQHLAWLTALRYQLREPRPGEGMNDKYNAEYQARAYVVDEHQHLLADALQRYRPVPELSRVPSRSNRAAQILALQTADLKQLPAQGQLDGFKHVGLLSLLKELYDHQGASERIKNFPYPRQYATLNLFYIRIFTFLLPFGMLQGFEKFRGADFVWLTIPLATLAGWIFTTMEKVGESSENPFEGSANDVPITQLSWVIEIDRLEMLGEQNVPVPIPSLNHILL